MTETPFIVALGSNMGDRRAHLEAGLAFLRSRVGIRAVSRVVESEAWGTGPQADFLNLVARGRTRLEPLELLDLLQAAEAEAGRVRTRPKGPRTLDVDLLFYGDLTLDHPRLRLPHPGWQERPFVFEILDDVVGELREPVSGRPLRELVPAGILSEGLREIEPARGPASDGDGPAVLEIEVPAGASSYPVRVGSGVMEDLPGLVRARAPASRYALIGDRNVLEVYGEQVVALLSQTGRPVDRFDFPPGESHKTRDEWMRLTDRLLDAGVGRDGCVVALGGGVTGDLAGFVAATYMRGIPLVQLPTSLVAMIDASVGGKTGVDVAQGKNLVGAFHPPRFVLADTRCARTLPRPERAQGLAEAVKHGAIADAAYLDRLERDATALLDGDDRATARAVSRSVRLKAGVVGRDEREGGLRAVLNFGHTVGHALEALSGYSLSHGSAVAMGMLVEARIGERLGVTAEGTAERLDRVLRSLELPTAPEAAVDPEAVARRLTLDKKARDGTPRFVLLSRIGRVHVSDEAGGNRWVHKVPEKVLHACLADTAGVG